MTDYVVEERKEGDSQVLTAKKLDSRGKPDGTEVILQDGKLAYVYTNTNDVVCYGKDGHTVDRVSVGEYQVHYADSAGRKLTLPTISCGMDDDLNLTRIQKAEIIGKAETVLRRVAKTEVPLALGSIAHDYPKEYASALTAYRDRSNDLKDMADVHKAKGEAENAVKRVQGSKGAKAPKSSKAMEDPNAKVAMGASNVSHAYEGADEARTRAVVKKALENTK